MVNTLPEVQYSANPAQLTNGQLTNLKGDSIGAVLDNPGVMGSIPTETAITVGTTSTNLLPANEFRTGGLILNIAYTGINATTRDVFISVSGANAAVSGACYHLPPGSALDLASLGVPTSAINAIAVGGSVVVYVQERS